MQISFSREGKKNIYIRAGFFNNVTAKIEHPLLKQSLSFKKNL